MKNVGLIYYGKNKYLYTLKKSDLILNYIPNSIEDTSTPDKNSLLFLCHADFLYGLNTDKDCQIVFKNYESKALNEKRILIRSEGFIEGNLSDSLDNLNKIRIQGEEITNIAQELSKNSNTNEILYSKKNSFSFNNIDIEVYFEAQPAKQVTFSTFKPAQYSLILEIKEFNKINYKEKRLNFLFSLLYLIRDFLSFCCNRRDIKFENIELFKKTEQQKFALIKLLDLDDTNTSDKDIVRSHLHLDLIQEIMEKVLRDLISQDFYFFNIMKDFNSAQTYNYEKLPLIMSGIEWFYYNRLLKNHSNTKKDNVDKKLNLELKIIDLLNEYHSIIFPFMNSLRRTGKYKRHEFTYSVIGKRVASKQRNYIIHPKKDRISQVVDEKSADLMLMELLLYSAILKEYCDDERLIQYSLRDLLLFSEDLEF